MWIGLRTKPCAYAVGLFGWLALTSVNEPTSNVHRVGLDLLRLFLMVIADLVCLIMVSLTSLTIRLLTVMLYRGQLLAPIQTASR